MLRWIASAVVVAIALSSTEARAENTVYDFAQPPVVRVIIGQGRVDIHTWNRPQVQIDSENGVNTERRTVNIPLERDVPIFEGRIGGPNGPVVLPAETFVVSTVPRGPREVVAVTGRGNVKLTVPINTPLLIVQVNRGVVILHDLRQGTFIVRVRTGAAILRNVGNDGFVQVMQGTIAAKDSVFNRLRMRSALANVFFEDCHAKQVEVTSVDGSIVYDNGSFEPGLARLESTNGMVALGVSGGANVSAHAAEGQVYTLLDRRSSADVRAGDGTATLDGGGPLITTSSVSANIYIYNGTLRGRRDLPPSWRPLIAQIRRTLPPRPG